MEPECGNILVDDFETRNNPVNIDYMDRVYYCLMLKCVQDSNETIVVSFS